VQGASTARSPSTPPPGVPRRAGGSPCGYDPPPARTRCPLTSGFRLRGRARRSSSRSHSGRLQPSTLRPQGDRHRPGDLIRAARRRAGRLRDDEPRSTRSTASHKDHLGAALLRQRPGAWPRRGAARDLPSQHHRARGLPGPSPQGPSSRRADRIRTSSPNPRGGGARHPRLTRAEGPSAPARSAATKRPSRPSTYVRAVCAGCPAATLCKVRLGDGPHHQSRIHLAERGHPLVGETVLNPRISCAAGGTPLPLSAPRRMLPRGDARAFPHPVTGELPIELRAAPPADFLSVLISRGRTRWRLRSSEEHVSAPRWPPNVRGAMRSGLPDPKAPRPQGPAGRGTTIPGGSSSGPRP
jgi:hypothetical protein